MRLRLAGMGYLSATANNVRTAFSLRLLAQYDAEWRESPTSVDAKGRGLTRWCRETDSLKMGKNKLVSDGGRYDHRS